MAEVVVQERGTGRYTQDVIAGAHRLTADEPVAAGGDDAGPNPYEYLLAALGACTSMTIRMYVQRKGWTLRRTHVRLQHEKIHAKDCAECETKEGKLDRIEREIELEGALSDEQKTRLMEIADRCPVHRTLTSEISIRTQLAGAPPRAE